MISDIWSEFLILANQEAGSRVVETWFKAVTLIDWDKPTKSVSLEVPNQFVKDWIQAHYIPLIESHLKRLLHVDTLNIILSDATSKNHEIKADAVIPVTPSTTSQVTVIPARSSLPVKKKPVMKRSYTFDTFVVGPSNSLAYAAAKAVAQKPGDIYNPLFVYGDSGLGKTHLLHAIGNEIKENRPRTVTLYQTADRFVTEFINAIRFDKVYAFQAKYKAADILLIDDIQFISNKEQTQEAFFHIFNTLYDAQKQIVFSSDTFPHDIQGLAERLRYRLSWGLVVDMYVPSFEMKIAILKRKAEVNMVALEDDVAHFIATQAIANVRELEGYLIRVMAFASLTGQPITLDLAKKVLYRAGGEKKTTITFERVVQVVSQHFSCDLKALQSKERNKDVSLARHVTMFLMKKITDKSLRDIGSLLGGRDHSTVMHGLDKVEQSAQTDKEFKRKLEEIEKSIGLL